MSLRKRVDYHVSYPTPCSWELGRKILISAAHRHISVNCRVGQIEWPTPPLYRRFGMRGGTVPISSSTIQEEYGGQSRRMVDGTCQCTGRQTSIQWKNKTIEHSVIEREHSKLSEWISHIASCNYHVSSCIMHLGCMNVYNATCHNTLVMSVIMLG